MCRSSLARRIDRRCSNDPQRGVGLDQTPLGIATTSRLGTTRMLDLPDEGAQIRFSDLWGPDPFAMWAALKLTQVGFSQYQTPW